MNLDRSKNFTLVNLDLSHFLRRWILTQLFWKRGELMVNLDPTNFLKRWTEVKTWGGEVQGGLWRLHKQNKSRNTQKRPNRKFCKNLHWIVCANSINLQKNDKQTVFEVYLTLTMPLNHVFRFLFKYGGWYLNCTYNYVCSPTRYENIWTNMG